MLLYNAQEPTDFESYQERGDIGFTDVAGAQIDTFMYEDLSNSRERNLEKELWKEVHKVHGLSPETFGPRIIPQTNEHAPKILQDAWNETAQMQYEVRAQDWEGFVEPNLEALKKQFPNANIRNRDEIDADIEKQAKEFRDEFEEMYAYADPYSAFFGTLGGAVVGSMADPINIMTMPLGVGKVAAGRFLKTLGVVAARSFGIGAVTEGAIQPFVYNYKQEINSPYELTDALFNMAAGGIGQGLLSGAGHAIGKGFSKLIGKQELPDTHETRALKRDIQKLLELQHFADETGAKTVGELEIHLNALNKAMADIQAGRKVDYDSLGKTIEREYLELFDTEINSTRSTMDHIANLRHQLEQKFDADLHSKQEQLQQFGEQKLSPLELKRAKAKADTQTKGELNQETDLDTIREIQKNDWEKTVGEDTVRLNDEANKANNELRASRRDEGNMIAMKKELDDLDQQYSDAVEYHRAAKKARDVYVAEKAEETSQAIKIAPTDTPRMRAVKDAVNRIVLSLGGQDIKVRVHEGNPELDGDMRFSMGEWLRRGFAEWKAAKAKGLDMSQEARMARAKEMGFDTETVWYHGSDTKEITEFDINQTGKNTPDTNTKGFYFTTHKPVADVYGKYIHKVFLRKLENVSDFHLKHPPIERIVTDATHIRSVNAAFDPDFIDSPNLRASKSGNTIEAAINPETGELHINASAFRDEAHLMEVLREEVIGHYGLRKALGDNFQSVIDDIKATAMTNTELRQMWVELSGIDPQTKQVINPNAPYKGMADDVIADEIISKMARNEISDTTWLKLKSIIIKALRKIGLVKDDITISEMKALVVKSEQALKKNASKPATITGLKPQAKPNDEALHNEAVEAEAARVINDETVEGVVFDENGNAVNFRDALIEDENEIAAIESVKVCML